VEEQAEAAKKRAEEEEAAAEQKRVQEVAARRAEEEEAARRKAAEGAKGKGKARTVMQIVMKGVILPLAAMVLKYWAAQRFAFGCQAVYRDTFYTSPRTAPAFVMS
jgi:hypothetical protein